MTIRLGPPHEPDLGEKLRKNKQSCAAKKTDSVEQARRFEIVFVDSHITCLSRQVSDIVLSDALDRWSLLL